MARTVRTSLAYGDCSSPTAVRARHQERLRLTRAIRSRPLTRPVDHEALEDERAVAYAAQALAPDPMTADAAQVGCGVAQAARALPRAARSLPTRASRHQEAWRRLDSPSLAERDWLSPRNWLAGRAPSDAFVGEGAAGKSRLWPAALPQRLQPAQPDWLPIGELPGEGCTDVPALALPGPSVAGRLSRPGRTSDDQFARYIHHRLRPAALGLAIGFGSLAQSASATLRLRGQSGLRAIPRPGTRIDDGHAHRLRGEWIRRYCEEHAQARLLVLDPSRRGLCEQRERSGASSGLSSPAGTGGHARPGVRSLLIAHPPKSRQVPYSGSTDWYARRARSFWTLGLSPIHDTIRMERGTRGILVRCAPLPDTARRSSYGPP